MPAAQVSHRFHVEHRTNVDLSTMLHLAAIDVDVEVDGVAPQASRQTTVITELCPGCECGQVGSLLLRARTHILDS